MTFSRFFSRSGSHGAGLCLFDVLGNLDLSKKGSPVGCLGYIDVYRYISTTWIFFNLHVVHFVVGNVM